jgi:hypothetical protein
MSSFLILNEQQTKDVLQEDAKMHLISIVMPKRECQNNSVSEAMYGTELPIKQRKVTTFSFQFKFALQMSKENSN